MTTERKREQVQRISRRYSAALHSGRTARAFRLHGVLMSLAERAGGSERGAQ